MSWKFADADDFHPSRNKAKMSQGIALTDEASSYYYCNFTLYLVKIKGSPFRKFKQDV